MNITKQNQLQENWKLTISMNFFINAGVAIFEP